MLLHFNDEIIDCDIGLLAESLTILDGTLNHLTAQIKRERDPDAMGLFDRADHCIGLAFVACQKYMVSTYGPTSLRKREALLIGPTYRGNLFVASIIDAAANYWKHNDEWGPYEIVREPGSDALIVVANLPDHAINTIEKVETITSWGPYTCANVLTALTGNRELTLLPIIPLLMQWRNAIARRTQKEATKVFWIERMH